MMNGGGRGHSFRFPRIVVWTTVVACSLRSTAGFMPSGLKPAVPIRHQSNKKRFALAHNNDSAKSKSNDDEDDDIVEEEGSTSYDVSEEEALLACYSYLQRHNRLEGGWKERRAIARFYSAQEEGSEGVGYFWEDLTQLKYFRNKARAALVNSQHNFNDDDGEFDWDDDDDDDIDAMEDQHRGGVAFLESEEEDDLVNDPFADNEELTSFVRLPSRPSASFVNRSRAKRKMWANPGFREEWLEKRWPAHRRVSPEQRKQRRTNAKLEAIPSSVLSSPELASMTVEEIDQAVRVYVESNQKRSETRKAYAAKNRQRKLGPILPPKDETTNETSPIISFLNPDEELLRERHRRRSESSRKAYRTRLANQQKAYERRAKKNGIVVAAVASESDKEVDYSTYQPLPQPRQAIDRINYDLDRGRLPFVGDVRCMMKPGKLSRRRGVLRRILHEHFDMIGKCVPANMQDPESELLFVTKCGIQLLGEFVLLQMQHKLLQQQERKAEALTENGAESSTTHSAM